MRSVRHECGQSVRNGFAPRCRPPRGGKAKATKSEALRQAALKLLRKPETGHPFYWAGFVLVGDDR